MCHQSEREDKVQAIATLIAKSWIMMKPRIVSEEEKQRKAAPLATYANVTNKDNKAVEKDDAAVVMMNIGSGKSLLQSNVEDVPSAGKLRQDTLG